MLALKAASLARGHSGVREAVVDTLLAVHNAGLVPCIPSQGSVGASGDLAPLAAPDARADRRGRVRSSTASAVPAAAALRARRPRAADAAGQGRPRADQRHAGLDRARAARAVHVRAGARGGARRRRADGRRGARQRRPVRPAHPRAARPAGADRRRAATTARCSPAARSAARTCEGDDRVQDPYCLRCQPQVVGACLDQLRHAALVLRARGQRRHRQPAGLRRRTAERSSPAATSTPSRWRSPPTRWRSRSPRSARSPSAASRC